MRAETLKPQYVEFMPKTLLKGTLYISKEFEIASHLCCCGCRTKIVTPLHDTEYRLTERAGLVSLHPSIGNWNHPCQSHYWIRNNRVVWAAPMSRIEIDSGRRRDERLQDAYYAQKPLTPWWRSAWERITRLFS